MSLPGPEGLAKVASASMANTRKLVAATTKVTGVSAVFGGAGFHEAVLKLPQPAAPVLAKMAARGILGGFDLAKHYPELGDAILVCATETKTDTQIARYAEVLRQALAS